MMEFNVLLTQLRFYVIKALQESKVEHWGGIDAIIGKLLEEDFVKSNRLLFLHICKIKERLDTYKSNPMERLKTVIMEDMKVICDVYLGDE